MSNHVMGTSHPDTEVIVVQPPGPGDVLVAAWMTSPAITVPDTATAWAAMERFILAGTRHLVVVGAHGGHVGMLTQHQLAALWPADPLGLHHVVVRDLIDPGPAAVSVHDHVADAARLMARHSVDAVTVLDAAGRVAGVLTGGDVVRLVACCGTSPMPPGTST